MSFRRNGINGAMLKELGDDDLEECCDRGTRKTCFALCRSYDLMLFSSVPE